MSEEILVLVAIVLLGLAGKNNVVIYAGITLLIIRLVGLNKLFPYIEKHGLQFGIIMLTVAVFSPLASGEIKIGQIMNTVRSVDGIIAILVGALVAYLGGKGINLLTDLPQIATGLIIGTFLGSAFFKGVPVGPVIAAGITSLLLKIIR